MKARALICDEAQNIGLFDVTIADPGSDDIVVRTIYSGVSIGTEFAMIRHKLPKGPYPICTGYMGVGIVEHVGSNIRQFSLGDRVYYRNNEPMELDDGQKVSATSGGHASKVVVNLQRTQGAGRLPEGVDEQAASLYVPPAVGLWGVDTANVRMGTTVVVFGTGLVGQGVVAASSQRGAVVVAIDLDGRKLDVARKLGAEFVVNATTQDVEAEMKKLTPDGADAVFEATGISQCIDQAMSLCRPFGKFVHMSNYGKEPVSYHFLPPHGKQLTTFYPCNDGLVPCRCAVLKNMATGVLPWHLTITHRISAEQAPATYTAINQGELNDALGVVIQWSA